MLIIILTQYNYWGCSYICEWWSWSDELENIGVGQTFSATH